MDKSAKVMRKDNKRTSICELVVQGFEWAAQPALPHTLSGPTKIQPSGICFAGSDGQKPMAAVDNYYYCSTCDVEFHVYCYKWPRKMTHPYHPQHPLILSFPNHETGIIYDSHYHHPYGEAHGSWHT